MTIYCVKRIKDGHRLYCGTSILKTAPAMEPGTCYGWGPDRKAAREDCERRRLVFTVAKLAKAG